MSHNGTPLLKTPSEGFTSHSEKKKKIHVHGKAFTKPTCCSPSRPLWPPLLLVCPLLTPSSHTLILFVQKGILLIQHLCTCCLYQASSYPRYLKVLRHFLQVCRDHIITEMPDFTTLHNTPKSLFLFFSIGYITAWHAPYLFVYFLCPIPYLPGRVQLIHCCVHRAYYIAGAQKMFVE